MDLLESTPLLEKILASTSDAYIQGFEYVGGIAGKNEGLTSDSKIFGDILAPVFEVGKQNTCKFIGGVAGLNTGGKIQRTLIDANMDLRECFVGCVEDVAAPGGGCISFAHYGGVVGRNHNGELIDIEAVGTLNFSIYLDQVASNTSYTNPVETHLPGPETSGNISEIYAGPITGSFNSGAKSRRIISKFSVTIDNETSGFSIDTGEVAMNYGDLQDDGSGVSLGSLSSVLAYKSVQRNKYISDNDGNFQWKTLDEIIAVDGSITVDSTTYTYPSVTDFTGIGHEPEINTNHIGDFHITDPYLKIADYGFLSADCSGSNLTLSESYSAPSRLFCTWWWCNEQS